MSDTDPTDNAPSSVNCIVNLSDGTEDIVEAFFLEIQITDIDDENLSDLRALIVKETRCVELLQFPFCLATGAVVQDSVSVEYYLNTCLKTDASHGQIEVYLKNENLSSEKKGWNDPVHSAYSNPLTGTSAKHISELEEKQWSVVVETNQLCYASSAITKKINKVDEKDKGKALVVGVQKSRHPAFRLATRKILSDTLASSMVKNVELDLRIPRHINDDPSYVSMRYSTSAAEKSLAKSGYTQTDISASGGGGAFGFGVDMLASLSTSKETYGETQTGNSKSDVTISYNFPRVTVFLDETGLELTPQCEKDLKEVQDAASYYKFVKKYGEFFSTMVQLGGELFATETAEENSAASRESTAKSMRTAAAVAMGSWGFSASFSTSHENASKQAIATAKQSSSQALIWQANGGNTLLCNDPPAWAPSVAYYGNWRVIKQGKVVRTMDLISKMTGFEYVRANLATWKVTEHVVEAPVAQKFTLNVQSAAQPTARYIVASKANFGSGEIKIGPSPEKRTLKYLVWELVLADGGAVVDKVEYGVDYYLMHRETMLYPGLNSLKKQPYSYSYTVGQDPKEAARIAAAKLVPVHMVRGIRSRDFTMRFRNEQDRLKTGTVQDGDTVILEFRQASEEIGLLGEDSSSTANPGLVVTKHVGYPALKLTYTEASESDLQEVNEPGAANLANARTEAEAKLDDADEDAGDEADDCLDE